MVVYRGVILLVKITAMNINERFGKRIKEVRKAKGLSQEKLANLAEVDRTYLPEVERGERNISLVVAEKIANALGEKLSKMIDWQNESIAQQGI